jgi:glycosyltransferase involved in cell wall biosynthesis
MKIAFVSTWDVPCGIATYTKKLSDALRKNAEASIYAEHKKSTLGTNAKTSADEDVIRCFSRLTPYAHPYGLKRVAELVEGFTPDVLHVQHEFGIFPRVEDLALLRDAVGNAKLFITAHTVEPARRDFNEFCKTLVNPVIVHSLEAQAVSPFPTKVIPHGCTILDSTTSENVLLVPGFVSKSKNSLEIIEAFIKAKDRGLTSRLRILGLCRDDEYQGKIRELISKNGINSEVDLELESFVSDERVSEELRKCRAVVLGGGLKSPYSASGQLHDAVGASLPILAKNLPIYRSSPYVGVLYFEDSETLSRLMAGLENVYVRGELIQRNAKVRAVYTWDSIAKKTLDFYSSHS